MSFGPRLNVQMPMTIGSAVCGWGGGGAELLGLWAKKGVSVMMAGQLFRVSSVNLWRSGVSTSIVSEMAKTTETGETHQRFATRSLSDPKATLALAIEAARLASDDKCEDVTLLDVRQLSQVSDYILICSGTSDRQMQTTAQEIGKLAEKEGYPPFRKSFDDRTTWLVVDCVDIVIHIFEPNTRAHYDLEMLWADAPRVDWERPSDKSRNRAGLE